jgi:hypothetical protein
MNRHRTPRKNRPIEVRRLSFDEIDQLPLRTELDATLKFYANAFREATAFMTPEQVEQYLDEVEKELRKTL